MIIIAVGSNLPGKWGTNSYDMCRGAISRLSERVNCNNVTVSPWYQTSPIPPSSQPLYINGVISFKKNITCVNLLQVLNEIEAEAGRLRQEVNEARPLDMDIIAFNDTIIHDPPTLIVPHPRAHLRGFVLYPLRDICPDWVHPELNQSVDELINALPADQRVDPYNPEA